MILLLHLITGEDIISEVELDSDGIYTCTRPARVAIIETGEEGPNSRMVGLGPVGPLPNNPVIKIAAQHVIFTSPIIQGLESTYREKFGSGLVTAPASALKKLRG